MVVGQTGHAASSIVRGHAEKVTLVSGEGKGRGSEQSETAMEGIGE